MKGFINLTRARLTTGNKWEPAGKITVGLAHILSFEESEDITVVAVPYGQYNVIETHEEISDLMEKAGWL